MPTMSSSSVAQNTTPNSTMCASSMKRSIENNLSIALSFSKGSSEVHNCRMLPGREGFGFFLNYPRVARLTSCAPTRPTEKKIHRLGRTTACLSPVNRLCSRNRCGWSCSLAAWSLAAWQLGSLELGRPRFRTLSRHRPGPIISEIGDRGQRTGARWVERCSTRNLK